MGRFEKPDCLLVSMVGDALSASNRNGVELRQERLVRVLDVATGIAGLHRPGRNLLPEFVRYAAVGALDILPIPGGYRIAVLIHCESEGNVLPQCSHVSLADSILDEGGNLFEGSPRDSMLSNIHGPGLDGFPDFTGQFELDPFVGRAEISAVDGAIIDGKQIRVNPLFGSALQ